MEHVATNRRKKNAYPSLVSFQHSDGVWFDLSFRGAFLPSPVNQQYDNDKQQNRADDRWDNPPFDRC